MLKRFVKPIDEQVKKDLKEYFGPGDYMVTAVAKDEPIRVYTLKATQAVRHAQMIHGLSPMLAAVAGRVMCGALLLSSLIKHASNQKLMLKLETEGDIKSVVAEVDGFGNVRCMVNSGHIPVKTRMEGERKKLDIGGVVGRGRLVVVKDIGVGEPYTGVVPLVSGEIGEDIAYYLWKSEQIPSAVAVGVLVDERGLVKEAGGYLVQPLGGASPKVVEEMERRVKSMPSVTSLLDAGKRPEEIAQMLLEGMEPHLVGLKEVKYFCPCNRRLLEVLIAGYPREELEEFIKENRPLEIECNFCKKKYTFSPQELTRLLGPDDKKAPH